MSGEQKRRARRMGVQPGSARPRVRKANVAAAERAAAANAAEKADQRRRNAERAQPQQARKGPRKGRRR